jgi:adenylate cyclase
VKEASEGFLYPFGGFCVLGGDPVTTEEFKRKLTAILSADVEGYSRLMGEDEDGTIRTLTTYRELMSTLIQKHRGRVVDSPGDNLLAEFGSVVDGVRCAVEIQEELRVRNAELPENRRMEFRIGINLGDVVEEGERIYGDGVNITARVEGLAEGGGICISGTVYDSIKNKLSLSYESMGEHTVKNITEPVRVYRMRIGPEAAAPMERKKPRRWRWAAVGALAVLIIIAGGLAIWNYYFRPSIEPASVEKMAYPLPDKPSIAVLPFVNMSGDPEQEFLSDGIAESIITALSQAPNLFVIARNSTFSYKGKQVKVQQVSEELGVRYVMEGSVQKAGDQVRITAQLVDAITGRHLWAEQYDRDLKDLFALQDEITLKILTALQVKLTMGEQARLRAKGTNNLKAYLQSLKALKYFLRMNRDDNVMARQLAQEAIALDPKFATPHVVLAWTHLMDIYYGSSKSPGKSIEKAAELAKKALTLDDFPPWTYTILAYTYLLKRQHEKAIAQYERAIDLNPNVADSYAHLGLALNYVSRPEDAIASFKKAIRLNPIPPSFYLHNLGRSYRMVGRYEDSIATYKKVLGRTPDNLLAHVGLSATYSLAGRLEEARAQGAEVLRVQPKFSAERYVKKLPFKDQAERERLIDALLKAGLPQHPPLPLPDKPSIAVLPFVNMSGDPEQEYFSDGLTEEIITALSKVSELFVIASSSTFTYKGKPVKIKQVAEELGVRYVLEGSVRKGKDRVRITAQLIDALTGHHLWAEGYDRELRDVLAVQGEIAKKIITALEVKLSEGEQARVFARGTDNVEAWALGIKGWRVQIKYSRENNAKAREILERALKIDPNYPFLWIALGHTHMLDGRFAWTKSQAKSIKRGIEFFEKALALDPENPHARALLGGVYVFQRRYDEAIDEGQKAIALDPNYADGYAILSQTMRYAGRFEESLALIKKAIRLCPIPRVFYTITLGHAYLMLERHEEAIPVFKQLIERCRRGECQEWLGRLNLARAYIGLGMEEEARTETDEWLRIRGIPARLSLESQVARVRKMNPYKDPAHLDRYLEIYDYINALLKAGRPD